MASMPWRFGAVSLALAVVLWLCPAFAAEPTYPELTGRVVDDAQLLGPDVEEELTAELKALEDKSSDQLVVVTVPSLQGYPIEDFGYQLGRHWGIGTAKLSNGVLLIVAPNEHKVRIEVGYGLEPIMTDASVEDHHRQRHPAEISRRRLCRRHQGRRARHHQGADRRCRRGRGPCQGEARRRRARGRLADGDLLGADAVVDRLQRLSQRALRIDHRTGAVRGRSSCRGRAVAAIGVGAVEAAGAAADGGFSGGGGSFGGGGASGGW